MENNKKKFNLKNIDIDFFESDEEIEEIEVDENSELYKKVKDYLNLDYPIKLTKDQDEKGPYWLAEHPDLPGCKTHGDTKEEALKNLDEAKISWMYSYADLGKEIPKPNQLNEIENCSGKILLRLPKELHFDLVSKAKIDGISLNQEILYLLSSSFGVSKSEDYLTQIINKLEKLQYTDQDNNVDKYDQSYTNILSLLNSEKKPSKIKYTNTKEFFNESFERIDKVKHKSDYLDYKRDFIQ
jgi:predicted RNase H-like HicB family nuclease